MTEASKTEKRLSGKPIFQIFRASDAANLTEETLTGNALTDRERDGFARIADGSLIKVLFKDEAAGVSLTYAWFKADYLLPQHSHDSDCLYYVISGTAHLGSQVLHAGDGFLVPANAFYTYQAGAEGVEVLEFRTAFAFDIKYRMSEDFWQRILSIAQTNRSKWSNQASPPAAQRLTSGASGGDTALTPGSK